MAQDNSTNILNWGRLILFGLALLIVYKLLRKFGLFGETQETKDANALSNTINPNALYTPVTENLSLWDRIFKKYGINREIYNNMTQGERSAWIKQKLLPNFSQFANMSVTLHNADKLFNDNEEIVYSIFRKLKTKYEVNAFATGFNILYKTDMFAYMRNFMDDSELSVVYNIVNSKPEF